MKKLILFILVLLLAIVVAVVGVSAYIYFNYLVPKPAEFEFSAPVTDITKIEVISVTKSENGNYDITPLSDVGDTAAFLADFGALECTSGLSIEVVDEVSAMTSFSAIRITYASGSYEVITAYGNLDSSLISEETTPEMLLENEYYFFNSAEFDALINKYSAK